MSVDEMIIPAFSINQKESDIYIFSMEAKALLDIAFFSSREIDRETGIERPHDKKRSTEIRKYLTEEDATLPNNIILNFRTKEVLGRDKLQYDEKEHLLYIPKQEKLAFIIDGQHRLRAFDGFHEPNFPIIVSAFENLSLAKVAEIFVNINYNQKPVSKSLVFDLLGISSDVFPKYFPYHDITVKFNNTLKSPWFGNIKMLGIGKGIISQSSFVMALEEYGALNMLEGLSEDEQFNLLWGFYNCLREKYSEYWCNKKYVLCKTVGFNAQMMLFKDIITLHNDIKKLSRDRNQVYESICKILVNLDVKFEDTSINMLVGRKGARELHDIMKCSLGWDNER